MGRRGETYTDRGGAQLYIHAMVSRLEDGFQCKAESMCFDTGAQALLVYADIHIQFMFGGGEKADVHVLGAAKGSGFKCDRRGMTSGPPPDSKSPGTWPRD